MQLSPQASVVRCLAQKGRITDPDSALLEDGAAMAGKKGFEGLGSESMMSMFSEVYRREVPARWSFLPQFDQLCPVWVLVLNVLLCDLRQINL